MGHQILQVERGKQGGSKENVGIDYLEIDPSGTSDKSTSLYQDISVGLDGEARREQ